MNNHRSIVTRVTLITWSILFLANFANAKIEPDVIFINGQFETLNVDQPKINAVAVKDEKIIATGSTNKIRSLATKNTKIIDLEQKFVIPGFVDAHTHPMETIWIKEDWVDARFPNTPSVKQALINISQRIKATPKDEWVFVACVSASENKFSEKRIPTKSELDAVAPNNPVILANGAHMAIANSLALKKLGVVKGVLKLPKGGGVLVDQNGEPSGVLTDAQGDIPASPSAAEIERYYKKDIAAFWNQYGFTSLLAITPVQALPVLQATSKSTDKPNIRFSAAIWTAPNGMGMPNDLSVFEMPKEADPAYYRFIGIKAWIDGENDCRTGYMYEKYIGTIDTDPPGGKGTLVTTQDEANQFSKIASSNKKISMLHCSGDAATDIGLKAYLNNRQSNPSKTIQRIEHFGMFQLTNAQLKTAIAMKKYGLHFSVQPIWLLELVNADFENMGPDRAKSGFKFNTMIRSGLEPAAGTDMTGIYLGNIDPFKGIYASVTRQSDKGIFEPHEAISVRDALKMWTIWPAKAMGEERMKGSIQVGKFADMVVLSDNIFQIPHEKLKDVKPLTTIVGGRVVYQSK